MLLQHLEGLLVEEAYYWSIVFTILLLVQFIVINKGSERIAEATARFTLDAMPGTNGCRCGPICRCIK